MNRRKLLALSMATVLALPLGAWATDYRAAKPAAWTAKTIDEGIKALYGDISMKESSAITLTAPTVVASGASVPVSIKSTIEAKTVSLFQDANPESAVAVWSVPEAGIVSYNIKVKLKTNATLFVLVEDRAGKFYTTKKSVQVTGGGCE